MTESLTAIVATQSTETVPEEAQKLADTLVQKGDVACVLYYGSGLWKESAADTVHDFYVLVECFRDFEPRRLRALWGRLMPPNVYYMEMTDENGDILRCKYALMRMSQFGRAAKGHSLTPQIWARFAQPCRVLFARDETARARLYDMLAGCTLAFLRHALRLAPEKAETKTLWLTGLRATYAAELRAEREERLASLYAAHKENLEARTAAALPHLQQTRRNDKSYRLRVALIRPLQKLFALVRLLKTAFTFDGAADYALWKVERQSGVRAEATAFQRRHPLIAGWPVLWRLWRKGALK